jgi:Predicted 6-phosphogluconate dehydrogenase
MNFGIVGLGKMGNLIASRVIEGDYYYKVFGFDVDKKAINFAEQIGVEMVKDLADLAERTDVVWLMLPAGELVDATIEKLIPHLKDGDIVIDGGNSHYTDSVKREEKLKKHGIYFLDCGVSGGRCGEYAGFSLTVGGDEKAYKKILPLLEIIAYEEGCAYVGPSGAGHYVKMVHNGIEYGLLQAYAEGFNLLQAGEYKNLDLEKISQVWQNGAVIRSFILELINEIYYDRPDFSKIGGEIYGGQTGKWALQTGKQHGVLLKILGESLAIRKWSQETGGDYSTKLVALLRNKFGGHEIKRV